MPAVIPFSAAPVETLRITNMRIAVRINSRTNDCIADPAGNVAPSVAFFGNRKPQDATSRERSCTLTQDVWNYITQWKTSRCKETQADRRI